MTVAVKRAGAVNATLAVSTTVAAAVSAVTLITAAISLARIAATTFGKFPTEPSPMSLLIAWSSEIMELPPSVV